MILIKSIEGWLGKLAKILVGIRVAIPTPLVLF